MSTVRAREAFFASMTETGKSADLKRKAELEGGGPTKIVRRHKQLLREEWYDLNKSERQLWIDLAAARVVSGSSRQ